MSYKDRFAFTDNHGVEHPVNGTKMVFYPNRYAVLQSMAELSKPIALSLMTLLMDSGRENAAVTENIEDGTMKVQKITVEAMSVEMITTKSKERERAVEQIIEALSSPKHRILLGRCLMDSLRDEFDYSKDRPAKEVEEFFLGDNNGYDGIDVPVFAELLTGWVKANSKVFGDKGEKLAGLVRTRLSVLRKDSPSEPTTQPANGSNSETASSSPLASDSPLTHSNA